MKGHCEVKAREKAKKTKLGKFRKALQGERDDKVSRIQRERERGDIINP